MAACDNASYGVPFAERSNGPGITHAELPPFRELLRQLEKAYEAEISYWKKCVDKQSKIASPPVASVSSSGGHDMPMQSMESSTKVVSFAANVTADNNENEKDGVTKVESDVGVIEKTGTEGDAGPRDTEGAGKLSTTFTKQRLERLDSRISLGKMSVVSEEIVSSQELMRYTYYDSLCYTIDTWISKRRSQAMALAILILAAVFVFGLIWTIFFFDGDLLWYENFLEGFWVAWTFMADPGTHAGVAGVTEQPRRIVAAMIAASGIIFMAATLGMIVDIIREKMENLRQGKSSVVEKKHTLLLGWTEKAVSIIEELCFANESAGGGTIVVLSNIPKETIEREFATQLPLKHRRGTRIVFRTGNPMVITDLMKVGAPTARATIVLANDGDPDNSDAETLRVVLSLRTLAYKLEGHVVVEVRDIDNEPLVKMVGGDICETVVSHDVLGRLMLMSARQPGLAKVYESLLGFQGDEFYLSEWPDLVGVTFGGLIERFPDAIPIGIFNQRQELELNPARDREVEAGDKILVIAEDDDTYKPESPQEIEEGQAPGEAEEKQMPSKILFCGWRRDIRDIVLHLDSTLKPGSEIHMITGHVPIDKRSAVLMDDGLDVDGLVNIRLKHHYGNPSVRRRLQALPLGEFSSCMIFADQAFESDTMTADSHSLASLLLLRDLQMQTGKRKKTEIGLSISAWKSKADNALDEIVESCPVVCEVLDPRTTKTINGNPYVRRASEFCQTNKISAQMIAMIAENRSVNVLFEELLGVGGNGVNVYPSSRYVRLGEMVSFWTVAKRASAMNETLIGHKAKGDKEAKPNPGEKDEIKEWIDYDFIVISKAEGLRNSKIDKRNSDRAMKVTQSQVERRESDRAAKAAQESSLAVAPETVPVAQSSQERKKKIKERDLMYV